MIFCSRAQPLLEVTHERNEGWNQPRCGQLRTTTAARFCNWSFCSRAIYHYYGVPAAVYEALLGAPSKGSYFNWIIRRRFPYTSWAGAQTGLGGGGLMSRTVASLPAGSRITDYISLGVVAKTFPLEKIRASLAATGKKACASATCRRMWSCIT